MSWKTSEVMRPFAAFRTEAEVRRRTAEFQTYLRIYMRRKGYHRAEAMFDLLAELTRGKYRNDGVTPEIHHPMGIAIRAIFAKAAGYAMPEMEKLLCGILGHDIPEDNKEWTPDKCLAWINNRTGVSDFNRHTAEILRLVSKKIGGVTIHKNTRDFLDGVLSDEFAFITKIGDRPDNLSTAPGVMMLPRLSRYDRETAEEYPQFFQAGLNIFPEYADIINRYGWITGMQLEKIRPLTIGTTDLPPPAQAFKFASRWHFEDKDFPLGLGLLCILQEHIDKVKSDGHHGIAAEAHIG